MHFPLKPTNVVITLLLIISLVVCKLHASMVQPAKLQRPSPGLALQAFPFRPRALRPAWSAPLPAPLTVSFTLSLSTATVYDALESLYDATQGAEWGAHNFWKDRSVSPCQWFGVCCNDNVTLPSNGACSLPNWATGNFSGSCCNASGIVRHLILEENNLVGTIPPAFYTLTSLNSLILPDNGLDGSISSSIGQLSQLRLLVLARNALEGTLPHSLSSLLNLQSLYLSINAIAGSLPVSLSLLPLHTLDVSQNNLDGSLPLAWGVSTTPLANLSCLLLGGNGLSGTIPTSYGNFRQLSVMDLSENGQLQGTIPPELGGLTGLEELSLGGCAFSGSIPPELSQLSQLTSLSLPSNALSGTIPASLGDLPRLLSLDLSNNLLSGAIPASLGQLTQLQSLNLFANQLQGTLPASLGNLVHLGDFNCYSNRLDGTIPKSMGAMKGLVNLLLQSNAFTGTIPVSLCQLPLLETFYLYGNFLTGSIPTAVGNMTKLRYLGISTNRLSGTIPACIGNLTNLIECYLSDNLLSGTIPSALGRLTNVNLMYLHNNFLFGTIPEEFGNLKSLRYIDLGHNKLTGLIPASLAKCQHLMYASFNENDLSGTLPAEVLALEALQVFSANENGLEGAIPTAAFNVSYFAVAQNRLSGKLPSFLNATTVLDVSFNTLTGNLKDTNFCASRTLTSLNLAQTGLGGEISKCLFEEMSQLVYLNLADNGLTGALTHFNRHFGDSYQMETLDISSNRLTGKMSFFEYFSFMYSLQLGSNQFSSILGISFLHFESTVAGYTGTAGNLKTLVASDNQFTAVGLLPSTLSTLIIARNAELKGTIDVFSNLRYMTVVDIQSCPQIVGTIPPQILESKYLKYLFLYGTSFSTAEPGQLPPQLYFSATKVTAYEDGDSKFDCRAVLVTETPDTLFTIHPSYYNYASCYCGLGYAGNGENGCTPCLPGTYNDVEQVTVCYSCPAGTYTDQHEAVSCESCSLPMGIINTDRTVCTDLLPLYVALVPLAVGAAFILSLGLAIALFVGATRVFRVYQERKLRSMTALIEKRSRDEIPADLLIRYKDLHIDCVIGSGSYAQVYKGKWNSTLVAIKEMSRLATLLANLEVEMEVDVDEESAHRNADILRLCEQFKQEVVVMSRLHHPNVLLLIGACTDFPHLCIVTEYMSNGSLYNYLHVGNIKRHITFLHQATWMAETAAGMAYLHDQSLVHRDLKSPNVLLDAAFHCKLCDFGLTRVLAQEQQLTASKGFGSLLWLAPEVILGVPYSQAADVYAYGILCWEILSPGEELYRGIPYYSLSQLVAKDGKRPPLNPRWPVGICSLMSQCWDEDPTQRLEFPEILQQLRAFLEEDNAEEEESFENGGLTELFTPLLRQNGRRLSH